MSTRRRASFNAASLTRRPTVSPDPKREELSNHGHQQRTPTSTTNITTNKSSSPATHAPTSSIDEVTPNIITVLSSILTRLIARNEQHFPVLSTVNQTSSGKKLSSFQGIRAPSISVGKYLERIHKYTNSSLSCFVVAYIYIDRLIHQQPDQPITSMNVHRLLVTSVMIAAKVIDDVHFNNAFYAKVGGISNTELNKLELNLLFCLDFRVQVSSHVFESYCSHMERELHSIGYVPIQRTLPVFGDSQEPGMRQDMKEKLDQH